MSKAIRLTEAILEDIKSDFSNAFRGLRLQDGKVSYEKDLTIKDRKAILRFTELAWIKMQALISTHSKEIGWYGVAKRDDNEENDEYIVSDIVVYPQSVTGTTVDFDQVAFAKWLQENDGDDRMFNLFLHGHSHVDMSVSPSPTDLQHQEEILKDVSSDGFYIFVIWNKTNESNIKIYDVKKNIFFDNDDVVVKVGRDIDDIYEFIKESKKLVKENFSSYSSSYPYYDSPYGYGNYSSTKKSTPTAQTQKTNNTSNVKKGIRKSSGFNKTKKFLQSELDEDF